MAKKPLSIEEKTQINNKKEHIIINNNVAY